MLSKRVCMACIEAMKGKDFQSAVDDVFGMNDVQTMTPFKPRFAGWMKTDEVYWENTRIVKCRVVPAAHADVDGMPPRWCKYHLEHMVDEQEWNLKP